MQDIHHLVMTTDKRLIKPSRLRDAQVEGSDNEYPTLPVGNILSISARENHRHRSPREVVGNGLFATDGHVKVADRLLGFAVAIAPVIATIGLCVRIADGVDLCCAVRAVTRVHRRQSKVRTTHYLFIRARQEDDEGAGGWLAWCHQRARRPGRSEEHTSELQSQSNLVCRLLLEK